MKRLFSAFLALCLLVPATAIGDETPRFYTFASFEKGLNSQSSSFLTPENQAVTANNVRFNNTFGGVSKRNVMLNYGSAGSFTINGLHRYYKADGTKKLVAAGSTFLWVGDDDAGTFQKIRTTLNDGKRWQFQTYKDVLIGMNGYDKAVKYDGKTQVTANTDGSRTAENLCAELGAPFAELNTGTDLDADSWYMYKVAFYDGTTYSYSTARSNAILTGAGVHNITLTDIPLGPPGTTARYIYRTEGQANQAAAEATSSYFLVDDIADNSTRTFNDTVTDATISADPAPTWSTVSAGINATPPLGSIAHIHDERLFVSGNKTTTSDVYWSDQFNPDYFDPDDYEPIRADDGDAVTFVKTQLGILTVGKVNTIQKIYTDGDPTDWVISDPFSNVGCPAQFSVAQSPLGIIYLARDGLYVFNGAGSQLLSDPIKPVINDILVTNLDDVAGIWFKNEYHMAYTSAESGATANNRVLVLDTIRNAYSVDTKNLNCFTAFDSGSDFGILYSGSAAADGKVWSDEGQVSVLSKRFKSEFEAGTFDDARVTGEENTPEIELAWDLTVDGMAGTIDAASGIIDRPDTDGSWTSPVYEINAATLGLLYWNESLNATGDVTWKVRTGADLAAVAAASYSSAFTNPNGSDLSALTAARYIQFKTDLTTSNIIITPTLGVSDGYLFKMNYTKAGTTKESSVLSEWKSGFKDFGLPGHRKFIRRVKVFYKGTSGSLTMNYQNDQGTANRSFTIDLSTLAAASTTDQYTGNGSTKVYTHFPGANTAASPAPVGQFWQFSIAENGTTDWTVERVEVMYNAEPIGNV